MAPTTVIVGLVLSVRTIRRMPLLSTVSVGVMYSVGVFSWSSCEAAHGGSTTGLVGADVTFSAPPNPLEATACPEGAGFSVAVMLLEASRYCLATRFTSATVTLRMAFTSSSGELRPSAASADDHSLARPGIELRWNSAWAISLRLEASTSSSGTPFCAYLSTIERASSITGAALPPAGKATMAKPTLAFG